ncbi:putative disease resistance protein RGA4 [Corylus avellana]|uniref:putative disease resistance protein RGA4 n=1 Tax=Corylus avellana TaxID=13451 RepID=UPI00286B618B|nr:putative disease resistance protein RGA4 [Corylus avellana]
MPELVFGIAERILEKLGSFAYEEFCLVSNVKNELRELELTMAIIKAVLLDAEVKQATNYALSIWLRLLRDIFYDVEDVLDEVECEVLRKQVVTTYGSTSRKVCDFFSCSRALAFRHKLSHKIKDISEKLGKIVAHKHNFNLTERHDHVMHWRRRDLTYSFVPPLDVIGRNDDKEQIISLLTQPDSNRHDNVIPIVALGGLGKTTIAKLVYDDKRVAGHFELRMWVCVSEDFDIPRLIKEILKSATGAIDETLGVDLWPKKLRDSLEKKKFLLVLDDVCNEDHRKWNELKGLLIGGSEESKILVTTRSNKVASIVSTDPAYTLGGLSYDDCLFLFVKWAFKEGEDKQYSRLVEIGKEIVKECKGVPLAIRTLGSLLFSKVDEREWKFVRYNEIWELEQKEGDILPALKLSYDQMPSQLKQCFALCSLFPKDYLFESGKLIAFWMAHGLLNKMPNQELEDVGNMYIKELLSKSFFQDVENYSWCYRFKMHDLVHDLALKVAEEECSTIESCTQKIAGTKKNTEKQNRNNHWRLAGPLPEYCRPNDSNPNSSNIGNYHISKLPNSICKLYNLQTLLLQSCVRLEQLPKDIRKMINLRYLTVATLNTCLFENGICLNSLRFLLINKSRRLKILFQGMDVCLTNLQTLVVSMCPTLTSLTHDIKHLSALETLTIARCSLLSLLEEKDNRDIKLSLKKLEIFHLPKLEVLPQWLHGCANTLQYLCISHCDNFMALPEWLPSMKSLQTLEISYCSKLSSLPEGMDRLTALRELTIEGCPQLDRSKIAHILKVLQLEDHPNMTFKSWENDGI